MKISNFIAQIQKPMKKEHQEPNKVSAPQQKKQVKDSVEVSSGVQEAKELVAKALASNQENDKVEGIKRQIERGEYQMDSTKLAEKMLAKFDD